jgi:hypothetical protein
VTYERPFATGGELWDPTLWLLKGNRHEVTDVLRNLLRGRIEREMPSIHDVHFGLRHVAAIGFRLRRVERRSQSELGR